MASRILGMSDVLSFVEKAQESMMKEDAEEDFNDYLKELNMLARMGSMSCVLKLIPGMNKVREAERSLSIAEAMVNAMTPGKTLSVSCLTRCEDPELLAKSPIRRKRVAAESGRTEAQVGQPITQLYKVQCCESAGREGSYIPLLVCLAPLPDLQKMSF